MRPLHQHNKCHPDEHRVSPGASPGRRFAASAAAGSAVLRQGRTSTHHWLWQRWVFSQYMILSEIYRLLIRLKSPFYLSEWCTKCISSMISRPFFYQGNAKLMAFKSCLLKTLWAIVISILILHAGLINENSFKILFGGWRAFFGINWNLICGLEFYWKLKLYQSRIFILKSFLFIQFNIFTRTSSTRLLFTKLQLIRSYQLIICILH